jgi:CHAT domain-containing protein
VECWTLFVLLIEVGWVSILYTSIHIINQNRWFRRVPPGTLLSNQQSPHHITSRHAIARMPVSDLDTQRLHRKERKKQKNMASKEEIRRENPTEKKPSKKHISSLLHSDQSVNRSLNK